MDPTRFHQQFAEDLRHQVSLYAIPTFKIVIVIPAGIIEIVMTYRAIQ